MGKESDETNKRKELKTFNADFDDYSAMAHYLGKKLMMRPLEILQTWSVPELIVAYGTYQNEDQLKAYHEIENHNKNAKASDRVPRINKYAVKFYSRDEIVEIGE